MQSTLISRSNGRRAPVSAPREKADGRYTIGFFLRLPARLSGAIAMSLTLANESLTKRHHDRPFDSILL
jgi:hypothetical protein